ncbi:MAG: peptidoglycan-associated lipoprotein Pal [Nisaea sp.]|jgi:peptidoglycan-associated lipoprotein|uniref:peptidoglycan-associated lipoprotein Pal n=1 Tax=Nisaea sp. TaxID=2024842 RepID=UPI001B019D6A|nr:peptidoglycan-associated lipoprotein Pal [Nisaea sp.]MBO6562491.1 peptidoglycan-associated lipoprotein Pal [Nisaea sp.]
MAKKFLSIVAAALLVAACSTDQETASQSGGAGSTVPAANQPATSAAPSGPVAGSREEFVAEVGDRVFFDFDKYDLTSEARTTLERQAFWLRKYPSVTVTIEGHCDERGTREYNLALGERRATAAKDYLVALGIDAGRIATISYGKERPVAFGSNEEAWAQNRRGVTTIN